MAVKPQKKKVKLIKNVLVDGKHVDAGSKIELSTNEAQSLVGAGQAEFIDEKDADTSGGVRMHEATHSDPTARHADPVTATRSKKDAA